MKLAFKVMVVSIIFSTMLVAQSSAQAPLESPPRGADGDLDVTFGSGGKVTTDFDHTTAVALQSDGKIVVAGRSFGGLGLARYNINGSLDTTFGAKGKVTTDFSGGQIPRKGVALGSDENIVLLGNFHPQFLPFSVARYGTDGSVDSTFGTAGKVSTDLDEVDSTALALQPDGKILVAGTSSGNRHTLVRYNSNGSLDGSFGTAGKLKTDFETAKAIAVQSDGKIVVAGFAWIAPGGPTDFALARYTSDGFLDTTFGTEGKVITFFNYWWGTVYAVALQSDGKIVAAGGGLNVESGLRLARYNSNGSLDTTFGVGGKVGGEVNDGVDANSVAVQSDGKIVVGTSPFVADVALIRYNNDGSLDTTFGTGGYVSGIGAPALALQFDGNIVAVAPYLLARYNGPVPIVRFDPALVLHGSFTSTFSGPGMTDETYFDVRFRYPGGDTDQVALNWQRGLSATHGLPTGKVDGTWVITGVRPHQNANDHSADFIPVSAALTVAP